MANMALVDDGSVLPTSRPTTARLPILFYSASDDILEAWPPADPCVLLALALAGRPNGLRPCPSRLRNPLANAFPGNFGAALGLNCPASGQP